MSYWEAWHDAYADPGSSLSQRLRMVQEQIGAWFDARGSGPVRVLSVCAGNGRDLIGVLETRPDVRGIHATLVELDPDLADRARASAARFPGVEVRTSDAGDPEAYAGLPPADLVLLCGVLGNISDADVEHVIQVLPALCARGARVVWTRSRRAPDLTPSIRKWFAENGFREIAFLTVPDSTGSVGVVDLGRPGGRSLGTERLFTFLRG